MGKSPGVDVLDQLRTAFLHILIDRSWDELAADVAADGHTALHPWDGLVDEGLRDVGNTGSHTPERPAQLGHRSRVHAQRPERDEQRRRDVLAVLAHGAVAPALPDARLRAPHVELDGHAARLDGDRGRLARADVEAALARYADRSAPSNNEAHSRVLLLTHLLEHVDAAELRVADAVAVALPVFILVVYVSRYISLGSITAALVLPVAFFIDHDLSTSAELFAFVAVACIFVIYKHKSNIKRILAGQENRLGKS